MTCSITSLCRRSTSRDCDCDDVSQQPKKINAFNSNSLTLDSRILKFIQSFILQKRKWYDTYNRHRAEALLTVTRQRRRHYTPPHSGLIFLLVKWQWLFWPFSGCLLFFTRLFLQNIQFILLGLNSCVPRSAYFLKTKDIYVHTNEHLSCYYCNLTRTYIHYSNDKGMNMFCSFSFKGIFYFTSTLYFIQSCTR